MKLSHYRKILFIRFLGYFLIQVSLITLILIIEPVVTEESKFRLGEFLGKRYTLPNVITSQSSTVDNQQPQQIADKGFGDLGLGGTETIVPVSTDFGIVIEKINANVKVIADVDPGNEKVYMDALSKGVAHAKGTAFPGQKGNIYLFSHSTDAPWNVVRFNAVFFLLNKLETGDRVIMFYQGRRFDYMVFDKIITGSSDIKYLTNKYDESILTLQTCDPPGTVFNRLIVRAKLAGV